MGGLEGVFVCDVRYLLRKEILQSLYEKHRPISNAKFDWDDVGVLKQRF
jgi:hypothetical protein